MPIFFSFVEHSLPVLPSVGGFVDAPLFVRTISVPQHPHIHRARIRWINQDAADLAGVVKTDVLPGCSSVIAAVHAIARGQIGTNIGFARAHVNHLWIGRSDDKCANGSDRLVIEDWLPNRASICRLPHAAIHAAEEEVPFAARHAADRGHPPGTKRPDQPPTQSVKQLWRYVLRTRTHRRGRAEKSGD